MKYATITAARAYLAASSQLANNHARQANALLNPDLTVTFIPEVIADLTNAVEAFDTAAHHLVGAIDRIRDAVRERIDADLTPRPTEPTRDRALTRDERKWLLAVTEGRGGLLIEHGTGAVDIYFDGHPISLEGPARLPDLRITASGHLKPGTDRGRIALPRLLERMELELAADTDVEL